MQGKQFDLITMGRCNIDLLSQQIGASFGEIETFSAQIGGSPANVAIGAGRLGCTVGVATAVGDDPMAQLVHHHLQQEGIDTTYVFTKEGQTNISFLGLELPSDFSLIQYRALAPERNFTEADVAQLPYAQTRFLYIAASDLAHEGYTAVAIKAAQLAQAAGTAVVLDLERHPDRWRDMAHFVTQVQNVWPHCQLIIGTEAALWTCIGDEPAWGWQGKQLTKHHREQIEPLMAQKLTEGQTAVLKRGTLGAAAYQKGQPRQLIPGFRVDLFNEMGAGDAFVSGVIYGRLQGWEWPRTLRYANACYAIVAKAYECAKALPTNEEVETFFDTFGVYELPPEW